MVFSETIKLDDQVSAEAKKAAAEVATLAKGLEATQKQLVKAQALGDIAQVGKLTKNVTAYKAAIQAATPPHAALAAAYDKAAQGTKQLGDAQVTTAASSAGLQEELAALTGGLSLVAEVAGAVVFGLGAIVVAGAAFAIKASEAKNASLSLWSALGQGKIAGDEIDDMLDSIRAKTGLTKDSLGPLTESFLRMGITGKDAMEGLTIAAASAEGVAKGGGAAFAKLYQQAKVAGETGSKLSIPYKKLENQLVSLGLNVDDLASQMGMSGTALTAGLKAGTVDAKKFGDALEGAITKKGAGPLQNLANSSSNLGKLLQEYLGDLFEDMGKDIAPFMAEVKSLFSILDSKANPSGQALKAGIGGFFKEVFASATKVVPMVKHFLLDVIIYGLKAYIAIKPVAAQFKTLASNATVIKIATTIFKSLAVVVGVVAIAFGVLVAVALVVGAALVGIQVAIVAVIGFILGLVSDTTQALGGWVTGAVTAAGDFVAGLVSGISAGAGAVVGAVKGLADGAVGAFKGALGIASPSRVMMQLGGHASAGFASGVEDGAPSVAAAAKGTATAAVAGAASAPAAQSSGNTGGGPSIVVTVEPGAVIVNGAGKSGQEITEEMIQGVWERVALGRGL